MAMPTRAEFRGGGTRDSSATSSSKRDDTAKAVVADQISLAVQSTSNLLHLMRQSSPSQTRLMKLPKNLLAKTTSIKNTRQVLEQMPRVISSLEAHVETGLQSAPHLKTVLQLLTNMENCQLNSLSSSEVVVLVATFLSGPYLKLSTGSQTFMEGTNNYGSHSDEVQFTNPQAVIDISLLHQDSAAKSKVIKEIEEACQNFGCFKIKNHGIHQSVIEGALNANFDFFNMPIEDKKELLSDDVFKPVRFASVQDFEGVTKNFLKLYAHPLEDQLQFWPQKPSHYREKMGTYSKEVRRLGLEIIGAIMESLNLKTTYLRDELERGMQIVAVNHYQQPTDQTDIHTDYSIITILVQSCPGLDVLDRGGDTWNVVPELGGLLEVLVGDHLEVISNGKYKSCVHRATTRPDKSKISIVSLQSLGMDDIVEPASENVNDECRRRYKESRLRDCLNHLASKQTVRFIETLRIE